MENIFGQEIVLSSSQIIPSSWQLSPCSENIPAVWVICYTLPGPTWMTQVTPLPPALQIGQYDVVIESKDSGDR